MVKGIALFASHFAGYESSYVLIGGAACDLWMGTLGLGFRATKDLDIVIVVDAEKRNFVARFWEFVKLGNYQSAQKSTGARTFYRFTRPGDAAFPVMLELFAKNPFDHNFPSSVRFTPIAAEDAASSLSAILMDEGYYDLVVSQRIIEKEHGLSFVPATALIPLKIRAWLDLTKRKERSEPVDGKIIKKHRNDIFLLLGTLSEDTRVVLSQSICADMILFARMMQQIASGEQDPIARSLGLSSFKMETALSRMMMIFGFCP